MVKLFVFFLVKMESLENKHVFINDVVQSQLDCEAVELMVQVAVTNVLVIYTGGTIGMKHTAEHGYVPVERFLSNTLRKSNRFFDPVYKMQKPINTVCATLQGDDGVKSSTTIELPALVTPSSLYNKRIRYSVLEYTPLLDSCNITMNDWVKIASDIEANYESFDAFLVLHGTDTMAYTASALSFMLQNLGKSVIITGSQVPLAELRTDAVENLLGSLTIAGHFVIPEVGLFFDNKLYRGNRCSKMNGVEFNAFDSPNIHPLVNLGVNIDVNWDEIWSPSKIARFSVHKELNPNVASLRLFPGITAATVKAFFYPGIQGVVLETFGAGNAPSNRPDILQILHDACTEGIVIVNCSQCKKASVVAMYQTGSALEKIGVIPGADMTPECALTKLAYLLSKYPNNPKKVRTLIAKNIRGELTETSQKPRFSYITSGYPLNTFLSSILGLIGHRVGADPSSGTIETAPEIEIDDINNASDHPESKKLSHLLVPLAFCHSAREGDIPILSYLCSEFPAMINLYSYDGMVLLFNIDPPPCRSNRRKGQFCSFPFKERSNDSPQEQVQQIPSFGFYFILSRRNRSNPPTGWCAFWSEGG